MSSAPEADRSPEPEPSPSGTGPTYRPRTQLFKMLVILWIFPSIGAVFLLGMNWSTWSGASGVWAGVLATRLEQWLALVLLAGHVTFAALARHYRHTEIPQPVPVESNDEERNSGSEE